MRSLKVAAVLAVLAAVAALWISMWVLMLTPAVSEDASDPDLRRADVLKAKL